MPNIYRRQSIKGSWTEVNLKAAVDAVQKGSLKIRAAGRKFSIPESTLRYRLKKNDFEKHVMGPDSQLGTEAEKKLAVHIKKLQAVGFAPTQRDVRMLAYNCAEALGKKHTFNKEKECAGKVWFSSFMRRHPELSVRKAQGISRARAEGMNREEVKAYFTLLTSILTENDLLEKPGCIWNCDEIGVQMNNDPGKVVAAKGSKDVHVVTSAEKGETVTILACCNAEGQFLPPFCIFKGVYTKSQYAREAPPGTVIKMRKESAYMNSPLFMEWLTEHFIPRKPAGKNILILDGHASHMNCPDMLQVASDNDVIILCLPSHTTHYLQPLDRVVFKPFKTYFKDACGKLVATRSGTGKISREEFGSLLNSAWSRCATVQLATSAFRATGIYPLNIDAIPEHAYLLGCDQGLEQTVSEATESKSESTDHLAITTVLNTTTETRSYAKNLSSHPIQSVTCSCQHSGSSGESNTAGNTPTKVLEKISPIPKSLMPSKSKRKQSATNVTDPKNILAKRIKKEAATKIPKQTEGKKQSAKVNSKKAEKKKMKGNDNECAECLEMYEETTSTSDWIECVSCTRWLHESCTIYINKCIDCGRQQLRLAKQKS